VREHKIIKVEERSVAAGKISAGDFLLSVNGQKIIDVFDYGMLTQSKNVELRIKNSSGERIVHIEKDEYEDLGLEFTTYLMDNVRRCGNSCIFCFVDRLPENMRESLYFKDDDPRLSFLRGNYVTLTNIGPNELKRLISHRLSPINISVHAVDKNIRVFMTKNGRAGKITEQIKMIADAGLSMNFQAVLCKSINDGEALDETVESLSSFYPHGNSLSIVPAGGTKHSRGLYEIKPYSEHEANEIIARVETLQKRFLKSLGSRFVFIADEFYLKAGLPFPGYSRYEGFPQLENGVGMAAKFIYEAKRYLRNAKNAAVKTVDIATGEAAYGMIKNISDEISEKFPHVRINVHKIINDFFGESVTVSGLLTGRGIVKSLRNELSGGLLIIPKNALREGTDIFLDDLTINDIDERLQIKTTACDINGGAFVRSIIK